MHEQEQNQGRLKKCGGLYDSAFHDAKSGPSMLHTERVFIAFKKMTVYKLEKHKCSRHKLIDRTLVVL